MSEHQEYFHISTADNSVSRVRGLPYNGSNTIVGIYRLAWCASYARLNDTVFLTKEEALAALQKHHEAKIRRAQALIRNMRFEDLFDSPPPLKVSSK